MAMIRTAIEREGAWNGELQAQTRDGRKIIVDCRSTLVRDEAGRPRARLSFLADVTEKKLLEKIPCAPCGSRPSARFRAALPMISTICSRQCSWRPDCCGTASAVRATASCSG